MKHKIEIIVDGRRVAAFSATSYVVNFSNDGGAFTWKEEPGNREYIKSEPPPKGYRKSETSGTPGS